MQIHPQASDVSSLRTKSLDLRLCTGITDVDWIPFVSHVAVGTIGDAHHSPGHFLRDLNARGPLDWDRVSFWQWKSGCELTREPRVSRS